MIKIRQILDALQPQSSCPLPHPAVSALFTITLLFLPSPTLSTTSLRLLFISSLSRLPAEPRASCSLARVNRIHLSVNTHVCVCWSVCARLYSIMKMSEESLADAAAGTYSNCDIMTSELSCIRLVWRRETQTFVYEIISCSTEIIFTQYSVQFYQITTTVASVCFTLYSRQ